MNSNMNDNLKKLTYAGIMAALCYVGYAVFPAISVSGSKVHLGNAFVVLGSFILGGLYGGLAGAVGLSLADILTGYAVSAPRTFICKLLIGLIAGAFALKIGEINHPHPKKYVLKWAIISSVAGLGFNCVFEPALKYLWYTLLTPDASKAQAAIGTLMAVTTATTLINTVINTVAAVALYMTFRPALIRAGVIKLENE